MRAIFGFLIVAILATACQTKEKSTGIEALETEFAERLLKAVSQLDDNSSIGDIQEVVVKEAQAVFGHHPDILKAEAAKQLAKLPALPAGELDGYEPKMENGTKVEKTDFPEIRAKGQMALLPRGWQPAFVVHTIKPMFLARQIGAEEMGRHLVLSSFLQPKIHVVKTGEVVTLAQKHIDDYFLFDLKLTDAGVFQPVRIRWMVKADEANEDV